MLAEKPTRHAAVLQGSINFTFLEQKGGRVAELALRAANALTAYIVISAGLPVLSPLSQEYIGIDIEECLD